MPKIRTNRSAAKRFRKTGGGGLKRNRAYASHLLSSKSRGRKRRLRKAAGVSSVDVKRAKRLLGQA